MPAYGHPPAMRPRAGLGVGRWLVVGASALCLLSAVTPLGDGQGIWLESTAVSWYMPVAICAIAAITLSVYGPRRSQLAACGFLLAAFFLPVRLMTFEDSGLGDSPALWVAAALSIIGAAIALVNGLRAGRQGA